MPAVRLIASPHLSVPYVCLLFLHLIMSEKCCKTARRVKMDAFELADKWTDVVLRCRRDCPVMTIHCSVFHLVCTHGSKTVEK